MFSRGYQVSLWACWHPGLSVQCTSKIFSSSCSHFLSLSGWKGFHQGLERRRGGTVESECSGCNWPLMSGPSWKGFQKPLPSSRLQRQLVWTLLLSLVEQKKISCRCKVFKVNPKCLRSAWNENSLISKCISFSSIKHHNLIFCYIGRLEMHHLFPPLLTINSEFTFRSECLHPFKNKSSF